MRFFAVAIHLPRPRGVRTLGHTELAQLTMKSSQPSGPTPDQQQPSQWPIQSTPF